MDENLICTDCKNEFLFTSGEADFFAQRGLSKPRRCKECRAKRKAERKQ